MRKSIKKIAATMLAATMVLGSLTSAFGYTAEEGVITDLEENEHIWLLAGNMTGWSTNAESAIFSETDMEGVVKFDTNLPASDAGEWERRFSILGNYSEGDIYVQGAWSRILLGEANYKATNEMTCLTSLAVDTLEAETEVTVYFDTRTATVYIEDKEGNAVDYTIGWLTNDRDETYYTVDEFATMSLDDFKAGLTTDRLNDLTAIAESTELSYSLFDGTYKTNLEGLANYVKTGEDYVTAVEEPTTEAPTTAASEEPTTAAPTDATTAAPADATTAAPTTAANQSTKTGDVAPVALMVVLVAAVAVVSVVAKKKEA